MAMFSMIWSPVVWWEWSRILQSWWMLFTLQMIIWRYNKVIVRWEGYTEHDQQMNIYSTSFICVSFPQRRGSGCPKSWLSVRKEIFIPTFFENHSRKQFRNLIYRFLPGEYWVSTDFRNFILNFGYHGSWNFWACFWPMKFEKKVKFLKSPYQNPIYCKNPD